MICHDCCGPGTGCTRACGSRTSPGWDGAGAWPLRSSPALRGRAGRTVVQTAVFTWILGHERPPDRPQEAYSETAQSARVATRSALDATGRFSVGTEWSKRPNPAGSLRTCPGIISRYRPEHKGGYLLCSGRAGAPRRRHRLIKAAKSGRRAGRNF